MTDVSRHRARRRGASVPADAAPLHPFIDTGRTNLKLCELFGPLWRGGRWHSRFIHESRNVYLRMPGVRREVERAEGAGRRPWPLPAMPPRDHGSRTGTRGGSRAGHGRSGPDASTGRPRSRPPGTDHSAAPRAASPHRQAAVVHRAASAAPPRHARGLGQGRHPPRTDSRCAGASTARTSRRNAGASGRCHGENGGVTATSATSADPANCSASRRSPGFRASAPPAASRCSASSRSAGTHTAGSSRAAAAGGRRH